MFKKSCKDAWAVVKRGNMFMLAIGLLLGVSFNAVVTSLANDVIMQAITSVFHVNEVKELKVGQVLIGKFLAALISFLIVSILVFAGLVITSLIKNAIQARIFKKHPPVEEEPEPTVEELILAELKKLNEKIEKNDSDSLTKVE